MKVLGYIVLGFFGLIVLFAVGSFIRNKAVGPQGWAMDNTEKMLRAQMKDPDSMKIRSSYTVVIGDGGTKQDIEICGVVDGRNSFGGFTGGTRFVSHSVAYPESFDTVTVTLEEKSETDLAHRLGLLSGFESVYWNGHCVDATHPKLVAPERKPY